MNREQLFAQLVESLFDESLFFGHGVIDAEDEAMMVMMYVLKLPVNEILLFGSEAVKKELVIHAKELVSQRLNTLKPMAYIVGQVQFAGLLFKSDERALVPRSPIAELILNNFQPWLEISNIKTALDLCTGSGCIGVALAKYNSHIQVDISDISKKALKLARINCKLNQVNQNVTVICSDLFSNLNNTYDLIVTNPPYVSESEYQELPEEYKIEPKLGLTTQKNGLRIPVEILLKAPEYLNDNGYLFLEVGYTDELLDDVFAGIEFEWINFKNGGQGVCVFTKEQLILNSTAFINHHNQL